MISFLVEHFYSRYAYGRPILDNTGTRTGVLQTMEKIGEPGEFLGQNALGDLTGLDQRKLNIMYCENAKANLITNEPAKP